MRTNRIDERYLFGCLSLPCCYPRLLIGIGWIFE